MMNFMDAVQNMIGGKRMIRTGLEWGGRYIIILSGQDYIWSIGKDNMSSTNSNIFLPSIDDILAKDWIVKTN